jgi:arylsulfatase A-like enzyme
MKITKFWFCFVFLLFTPSLVFPADSKPNVIIIIADDMGWKDTAFNGNTVVKTPALDEMARNAVHLDFFYAAGTVCCPGRYAILTGRQPLRGRVIGNVPDLRTQEQMMPRVLKAAGYRSGYFGKWHLGYKETAPVPMGFDEGIWSYGAFDLDATFDRRDGKPPIQTKGDGSLAIMDLAIDFIRENSQRLEPFLAMIAFTAPHRPHIAAPEFKALYKDLPEKESDFLGEISGLDAAVGKLREELKKLGIEKNTLVWFTSDNGGARKDSSDPSGKGKGALGARTISLIEWPLRFKPGRINVPCGHVDMLPTVTELAGLHLSENPIVDGISIVSVLERKSLNRRKPLMFLDALGNRNSVETDFVNNTWGIIIDNKLKLYVNQKRQPLRMYDIYKDEVERNNLIKEMPDIVTRMKAAFDEWKVSVKFSYEGKDLTDGQ